MHHSVPNRGVLMKRILLTVLSFSSAIHSMEKNTKLQLDDFTKDLLMYYSTLPVEIKQQIIHWYNKDHCIASLKVYAALKSPHSNKLGQLEYWKKINTKKLFTAKDNTIYYKDLVVLTLENEEEIKDSHLLIPGNVVGPNRYGLIFLKSEQKIMSIFSQREWDVEGTKMACIHPKKRKITFLDNYFEIANPMSLVWEDSLYDCSPTRYDNQLIQQENYEVTFELIFSKIVYDPFDLDNDTIFLMTGTDLYKADSKMLKNKKRINATNRLQKVVSRDELLSLADFQGYEKDKDYLSDIQFSGQYPHLYLIQTTRGDTGQYTTFLMSRLQDRKCIKIFHDRVDFNKLVDTLTSCEGENLPRTLLILLPEQQFLDEKVVEIDQVIAAFLKSEENM